MHKLSMQSSINIDGLLNYNLDFNKRFSGPIAKGGLADSTETQKMLAEVRKKDLANISSRYILGRTAEINASFLPPKTEVIVMFELSPLQVCFNFSNLEFCVHVIDN